MAITTTQKTLTWALSAITSIATFFAIQNGQRVTELKESKQQSDEFHQKQIDALTADRNKERRDKDSLQALMLLRTDNSYEELKKMIDINKTKSTITIKPKK